MSVQRSNSHLSSTEHVPGGQIRTIFLLLGFWVFLKSENITVFFVRLQRTI